MSEDLNKRLVDLKNGLIDSALSELNNSKTSSGGKRCGIMYAWLFAILIALMYMALIWYVLYMVFKTLASENVMALVIVVVLLSVIVVLILSGVFLLRMREYGIDEKRLTCTSVGKKEQKKDKAIEELKDNFLKQVIDDTLKS